MHPDRLTELSTQLASSIAGKEPQDVLNLCQTFIELAVKEVGEWQPIETAPKDGTRLCITGFCELRQSWIFKQDYWRQYHKGFGEGFGTSEFKPTRWMPLPNPPTP